MVAITCKLFVIIQQLTVEMVESHTSVAVCVDRKSHLTFTFAERLLPIRQLVQSPCSQSKLVVSVQHPQAQGGHLVTTSCNLLQNVEKNFPPTPSGQFKEGKHFK